MVQPAFISLKVRRIVLSNKPKVGIFAGTFDPLTKGHLNLIERSSKLFDEVIVVIAINTNKKTLFTVDERIKLVEDSVKHIGNVTVDTLKDGLIAHYYEEKQATALIRGLRNTTDVDYEYAIASANARQVDGLETMILYAADQYRYLSSTIIKEIAFFDGDISDMVPPNVEEAMREKINSK